MQKVDLPAQSVQVMSQATVCDSGEGNLLPPAQKHWVTLTSEFKQDD